LLCVSTETTLRRLLTVDQTAEYLNITPRMVRKLAYENELAKTKVGRAVRFDLRELDRYIDARTSRREAV
jgi:excisionase family DNA binding protein